MRVDFVDADLASTIGQPRQTFGRAVDAPEEAIRLVAEGEARRQRDEARMSEAMCFFSIVEKGRATVDVERLSPSVSHWMMGILKLMSYFTHYYVIGSVFCFFCKVHPLHTYSSRFGSFLKVCSTSVDG